MEQLQLLVQIDELKQRLEVLARENAALRVERDIAWSQVRALLPKATPEQEEEFRKQLQGRRHSFEEVMAELDRNGSP